MHKLDVGNLYKDSYGITYVITQVLLQNTKLGSWKDEDWKVVEIHYIDSFGDVHIEKNIDYILPIFEKIFVKHFSSWIEALCSNEFQTNIEKICK